MTNISLSIQTNDTAKKLPQKSLGLNLEKHFEDLKLIMQVSYMMIGNTDAISQGFKKAIKDGVTPTKKILTELQGMADDNFGLIMSIVGEETACDILKYKA